MNKIRNQKGIMALQAIILFGVFVFVFSLVFFHFEKAKVLIKVNEPIDRCRSIASTAINKVSSKDFQITYPLRLMKSFYYSGNAQLFPNNTRRWENITFRTLFNINKEELRRLEWFKDIKSDPLWASYNNGDLDRFEEKRWPDIPVWKFSSGLTNFNYLDPTNTKNSLLDDRTNYAAALLAMNSSNFLTALIKTYPALAGREFVEAPLLAYLIQQELKLDPSIQNLKFSFKILPQVTDSNEKNRLVSGNKYVWPLALTDPPSAVGFSGVTENEVKSYPDPLHPDTISTGALRIGKDFVNQRSVSFLLQVRVNFNHVLAGRESNNNSMTCVSEGTFSAGRYHHSFYGENQITSVEIKHQTNLEIIFQNMGKLKEYGVFPFCYSSWTENREDSYGGVYSVTLKSSGNDVKLVPCHLLKLYGKLPSKVAESDDYLSLVYTGIPVGGTPLGNNVWIYYYLVDWAGNYIFVKSTCSTCVIIPRTPTPTPTPVGTPCICQIGTEPCCYHETPTPTPPPGCQCLTGNEHCCPCTCRTGREFCCPPPPWDPPPQDVGYWVGGQQFKDADAAAKVAKETGRVVTTAPTGRDDKPAWLTTPPSPPGILNNLNNGRDTFKDSTGAVNNGVKPDTGNLVNAISALETQVTAAMAAAREQLDKQLKNSADERDQAMYRDMNAKLDKEKKEFEDKIKELCKAEASAQDKACEPTVCTGEVLCGCGFIGKVCKDKECGSSVEVKGCDNAAYGNVKIEKKPSKPLVLISS